MTPNKKLEEQLAPFLEEINKKIEKKPRVKRKSVPTPHASPKDSDAQLQEHDYAHKNGSGDALSLFRNEMLSRPFLTLFEHYSLKEFSGKNNKVNAVRFSIRHPNIFKICLISDYLVTFTYILLLLFMVLRAIGVDVGAVYFKTIETIAHVCLPFLNLK